jgi:hypothetical protein
MMASIRIACLALLVVSAAPAQGEFFWEGLAPFVQSTGSIQQPAPSPAPPQPVPVVQPAPSPAQPPAADHPTDPAAPQKLFLGG